MIPNSLPALTRIKISPENSASDPESLERFKKEARTSAASCSSAAGHLMESIAGAKGKQDVFKNKNPAA